MLKQRYVTYGIWRPYCCETPVSMKIVFSLDKFEPHHSRFNKSVTNINIMYI